MKNRKILFSLIGIIVIGLFLSACSNKNSSFTLNHNEDKLKVASSIFPIYSIVQEVGGSRIENYLILPAGVSPHTYDASPKDIKNLQDAKVVFSVGAGSDKWLQGIINSIPGLDSFSLENSVNISPFINEDVFENNHKDNEKDDHYHDKDLDPHYWLSPNNAKLIADAVASKLAELDPSGKEEYISNASIFNNKLVDLDKDWQLKLSQLENKKIIVFHNAWNYFAQHFNLEIAGSFEPFAGKSPGPLYLKELQNTIKKENIKVIFTEPQLSQDVAQVLASDLDIKVEILDPLGGSGVIDDYFSLIDYNVSTIYKSLIINEDE